MNKIRQAKNILLFLIGFIVIGFAVRASGQCVDDVYYNAYTDTKIGLKTCDGENIPIENNEFVFNGGEPIIEHIIVKFVDLPEEEQKDVNEPSVVLL